MVTDDLVEAARRGTPHSPLARCPYCRRSYRPHPGFADHRDECDLNPMNRPHIIGTANAAGIDLSLRGESDA
jgi:hypothetical protein